MPEGNGKNYEPIIIPPDKMAELERQFNSPELVAARAAAKREEQVDTLGRALSSGEWDNSLAVILRIKEEDPEFCNKLLAEEKTQELARHALDAAFTQLDVWGGRQGIDEDALQRISIFADTFGIDSEYLAGKVEYQVGALIHQGQITQVDGFLKLFPTLNKDLLKTQYLQGVVQETLAMLMGENKAAVYLDETHTVWRKVSKLVGIEDLQIPPERIDEIMDQDSKALITVVTFANYFRVDWRALSPHNQRTILMYLGEVMNNPAEVLTVQKNCGISDADLKMAIVDNALEYLKFDRGAEKFRTHITDMIDSDNIEDQRIIMSEFRRVFDDPRSTFSGISKFRKFYIKSDEFMKTDQAFQDSLKNQFAANPVKSSELIPLLSAENLKTAEIRGSLSLILSNYLRNDNPENFLDLYQPDKEFIELPSVQAVVERGGIDYLHVGRIDKFLTLQRVFLSEDVFNREKYVNAAKKGLLSLLRYEQLKDRIEKLIELFNISEKDLRLLRLQSIIGAGGTASDPNRAREIINQNRLPSEITEYKEHGQNAFRSLANLLGFKKIEDFLAFMAEGNNVNYYDYLENNGASKLEQVDLSGIKRLHLNLYEAELLKRTGTDFAEIAANEDFERLFLALSEEVVEWQDEQNVLNPMKAGAEIFGWDRMFEYIDKKNVTRHDALHAFSNIIKVYELSDLSPEQFYGNILEQVNRDSAGYESGTAMHELNSIALSFTGSHLDFETVRSKVSKYREVPMLQQLVEGFGSVEDVFSSWKNFKRYNQLVRLLERSEILDQLVELKKTPGKERLYRYIEILAFHPNSNVDMQAVTNFWRKIEEFLKTADSHTPEAVHNRKKPSNYTNIPNLDLSAEQLRDALVEGKLDGLQAFKPLEIEYQFGDVPLRTAIKRALGSRKANIEGEAKNPGKIFSELRKAFSAAAFKFDDYLKDENIQIPAELSRQLETIVGDPESGMDFKVTRLVAKVNLKSDPEAVLAGNDTACCMPFGSGKNNVYTFNPVTSMFTLQIRKSDGNLRTIAQSVLTKDVNAHKLVPEIIADMNTKGEHVSEIVPENILSDQLNTLACDNVETAPNYKNAESARLIEAVYRDFFAEYMQRYAQEQNLDSQHAVVGKGYSDGLTNLDQIDNTYVPAAPLGYSDKTHDKVYDLSFKDYKRPENILGREIREVAQPELLKQQPPEIEGIDFLTFEDTLPVAYLEGKIYSENQSLITYLHNMENGLIAKDINNAAKDRPNMSVKYTDNTGRIRGYIFAYEGAVDPDSKAEAYGGYVEDDYNYTPKKETSGERAIYISDLATDQKGSIAGGRLVQAFSELYRANYIEKGNLVPVYAQAREQTSFRLLQRQLSRISKNLNVDFELEELPTYKSGPDTMHPVMIRPVASR